MLPILTTKNTRVKNEKTKTKSPFMAKRQKQKPPSGKLNLQLARKKRQKSLKGEKQSGYAVWQAEKLDSNNRQNKTTSGGLPCPPHNGGRLNTVSRIRT